MKKYIAECIGTFTLVFCGTGAIIINSIYHNAIGNIGISIAFGVTVMLVIFAIGKTSGAHINPAVSAGFWLTGHIKSNQLILYWIAQYAGALFASLMLQQFFQDSPTLGETLPSGPVLLSFLLEILLTFLLVFIILRISVKTKSHIIAGILIGATVGMEALIAGPISGASMNPARSAGPALIAKNYDMLWIYLSAPFIGAILSVYIHKRIQRS